jgi:Na+-transporting methylmalonyl-CoA/oxaloacetate decarboxylase gamma subunit
MSPDVLMTIAPTALILLVLALIALRLWAVGRLQRRNRNEWMIEVRRQSDALEQIAKALSRERQ